MGKVVVVVCQAHYNINVSHGGHTLKLGRSPRRQNMSLPILFRNRDSFLDSFDHILDNMFGNCYPRLAKDLGVDFFEKSAYPKCNIISLSDSVVIEAAVPGFQKEDIKLEIKDNVLSLSATKSSDQTDNDQTYVRREIKRSGFSRSFILDDSVDVAHIEASHSNGMLTLTIPRKAIQESNSKFIDIK